MMGLCHAAVCFWLRRQTILIIKGIVEFAVIEQTCTCFLSGESSICEYIYFFYFRGCCLDDFLMHSLLKPAIIASQSQKDS